MRVIQLQFDGALIEEQGVTFAIVVVTPEALNNIEHEQIRNSYKQFFPGDVPIVLMALNDKGAPIFDGRPDIVMFLAGHDYRQIPWKRFTVEESV